MEEFPTGAHILVVDDAPQTLEVLQRNLSSESYEVFTAGGLSEAIAFLKTNRVDLVVTDLKMPGGGGLDLVRHVRENLKDTGVMVITGYPSVTGAVAAVKSGAEEFLAKPFTDKELFAAVRRTLDKLRIRRTVSGNKSPSSIDGMVGESSAMQEVFRLISKAAVASATVLITGESGTGKELVARAVHYSGPRASAPFLPVNCGGIPHDLLESELFGHVKGSFTGATESRAGFFQTADGGTIFLDEIGETDHSMQVKLLRVLQDKKVFMVGSRRPQDIDIRIICATNKNLIRLVESGQFREDLFYRLNVINIDVPSLRDREGDVPLLMRHFLDKFSREAGKTAMNFSDEALAVFQAYHWPGNVRELENLLQRLVVMSEGDLIGVPDLPPSMRFSASGSKNGSTLAEVEYTHIQAVLASVAGNKSRAAKILGIDRKTLHNKLRSDPPPSDNR